MTSTTDLNNKETEDKSFIFEKLLSNPPISDGSKRIKDGVLEIIGHYTLSEISDDYAKAMTEGNTRKEVILEYVSDRLFQRIEYIDRIMVTTFNNEASFSVSMKDGYTLQMQIEDCNKAIQAGRNPQLGKLDLETMEIV